MRKMMACMLGAALCFSMAGAETGVSSAEKASPLFGRMIWNRGWEFRLEDEPGKSGWQTVHLPHTFSLPYFMSDSFYTGFGDGTCGTVRQHPTKAYRSRDRPSRRYRTRTGACLSGDGFLPE